MKQVRFIFQDRSEYSCIYYDSSFLPNNGNIVIFNKDQFVVVRIEHNLDDGGTTIFVKPFVKDRV